MLLFKPEHVDMILAGRKTQTRRIWKKRRAKVRSTHLAKTKMLSPEYFAKLYIFDIRDEKLGSITDADAQEDGYAGRDAFIAKFKEINSKTLKKLAIPAEELQVTVLKFKVVM